MRIIVVMVLCLVLYRNAKAEELPLLHELFSDHVVLQRDQPVAVWGNARPGAQVTVKLGQRSAIATADASGHWKSTLTALPMGGGPYQLIVESAGQRQQVNDVLIGDVWLCSGQSNMVLPVHRTLDSRSEIAGSANDTIRMLTVTLNTSLSPLEHFADPVSWLKAEPRNVPEFSATCFYFARELQKTTHAPMGLINSSWGGSRIEAWMSRKGMSQVAGYGDALNLLAQYGKAPAAARQAWGRRWETWWRSKTPPQVVQPWDTRSSATEWRAVPKEGRPWEKWEIAELANFDGMLWYRTTVNLTSAQAKQPVRLSLGRVDEIDTVWVNGRFVDTTSGPDVARVYQLAADVLHEGDNIIVVNVLDTYGDGGLTGPPRDRALTFADGSTVDLSSGWQFQQASATIGSPPRAPWEAVAGLTTIHNAMIAPLEQLRIKGVVWYQGESNTSDAHNYQALLTGFMSDWRGKFGAELPFLIVQLANYGMPVSSPVESDWAQLREAQRRAVMQDKHAALAVTIDIGDRYDIHPSNKQELGRRLAWAARRLIDHDPVAASGPSGVAAHRAQGKITMNFADVDGELIAYGASRPIGFELCGARPNSCRFADAEISGKHVLLTDDPQGRATRVRYCWADGPVCTLYDKSTLPVGPFELSIDPKEQ